MIWYWHWYNGSITEIIHFILDDDDDSVRVAFSLSDSIPTPRSGNTNSVDGHDEKDVLEETKKGGINTESGMKDEEEEGNVAGGEDTVKQVIDVEGDTTVEDVENADEADFGGEDKDVEENMSEDGDCDEDDPDEQGESRRIPVTFSQLFESGTVIGHYPYII